MATYFVPSGIPVQVYADDDPAANYVLHAFLAGTSTPTNMFSDNAGGGGATTKTLDSEGYIQTSGTRHPIWLDDSIVYDLELREDDDTTVVWKFEDITVNDDGKTYSAQVNGLTALRGLTPGTADIYLRYHTTAGDQGHGHFRPVTGASPGTYVDNDGTIIPPSGGDGSAAWLRDDDGPANVRWFGATGDGATNDDAAVQNAIDAYTSDQTFIFPPGTYVLSAELDLDGKDDFDFFGYGATIKGTSSRFQSYFNISGADNIRFYGFNFDLMFGTVTQYLVGDYPTIYNCAIYGDGAVSAVGTIEVYDCRFSNLYTRAIDIRTATAVKVSDCEFTSPVQNQNQIIDHIAVLTIGTFDVYNCFFDNAMPPNSDNGVSGISFSGVSIRTNIENNYFNWCGRNNVGTHRLAVIDLYYDGDNVTVRNNTSNNTLGQFMRLSACWGGLIEGNYVHQASNSETGYTMLSVEGFYFGGPPASANVGNKNVTISNNILDDSVNRQETCIGIFGYDWGLPHENIKVIENTIIGAKNAVLISGGYDNILIKDNDIKDYFSRIDAVGDTGGTFTELYGTQANSAMSNLVIEGNSLDPSNQSAFYIITYDAGNKSPVSNYTGNCGPFRLRNNRIKGNGIAGGGGVAVLPNQSTKTLFLSIDYNYSQNNDTDYYIRGTDIVKLTNNYSSAAVTQFYLDDGSNDEVHKRFNQLTEQPVQGTATLVAGAVTVNTTEVRTGDTIIVTRGTRGGTTGELDTTSIVNGVSFQIRSTNGADTSTVFWEIIH